MSGSFAHVPVHQVDQKHAQTAELLDAMVTGWRDELADMPETDAWLAGIEAVIRNVANAAACDPGRYQTLLASLLALAIGRLADGEGR